MSKAIDITKTISTYIGYGVGLIAMIAFVWFQFISPIINPHDKEAASDNIRCETVGAGVASYEECVDVEDSSSSDNCLIKGNVNPQGDKIYHLVSDEYYDKTDIDSSRGERWFCTEQEALQNGWRHASSY